MYFRPYATVSATDPEETISAFGNHSDMRCTDAPKAHPVTLREIFAPIAALWKKYLRVFD